MRYAQHPRRSPQRGPPTPLSSPLLAAARHGPGGARRPFLFGTLAVAEQRLATMAGAHLVSPCRSLRVWNRLSKKAPEKFRSSLSAAGQRSSTSRCCFRRTVADRPRGVCACLTAVLNCAVLTDKKKKRKTARISWRVAYEEAKVGPPRFSQVANLLPKDLNSQLLYLAVFPLRPTFQWKSVLSAWHTCSCSALKLQGVPGASRESCAICVASEIGPPHKTRLGEGHSVTAALPAGRLCFQRSRQN